MLLKEKLSREQANKIYFYREGMFWKLYNLSAYNFSRQVKQYLVKKKYIKEIKEVVVSVGFPDKILQGNLEKLKANLLSVNASEKVVEVVLKEESTGYKEWFDSIEKTDEVKPGTPVVQAFPAPSASVKEQILKDLRDFPVLQKTPLEVQWFFVELQNRVMKLEE